MSDQKEVPEWQSCWKDHSFPEQDTTASLKELRYRLQYELASTSRHSVYRGQILSTISAINNELSERNNEKQFESSKLLAMAAMGIAIVTLIATLISSILWENKQMGVLTEIRDLINVQNY